MSKYYAYNLPADLTKSLEPLSFEPEAVDIQAQPSSRSEAKNQGPVCSTCQLALESDGIRDHYKSDYHRFNVKRRIRGDAPLSEDQFNQLDLDNESISGSDSDSDDLAPRLNSTKLDSEDNEADDAVDHRLAVLKGLPYLLFTCPDLEDKCIAMYKSLFQPEIIENPKEALPVLKSAANGHSVILMIGGGHFSGAVISHTTQNQKPTATNPYAHLNILAHKTFHRYTTRRKQGGSQSASDNAHGKANSAGSSLRRYNEMALQQEIRQLLAEWTQWINSAHSIYIRASGHSNRGILMNYDGAPITSKDARVRGLPFTTRRATANEVKRAWVELTKVVTVDKPAPPKAPKQTQKETDSKKDKEKKVAAEKAKVPTVEEKHTTELTALIKKSRAPRLIAYYKANVLDPEFRFVPDSTYANTPNGLFYASSQGAHHIVTTMLMSLGADPTVTNAAGRHPYEVASDRATKDAFQLARASLGEEKWNWDAAKVGPPLTKDEIKERDAEEARKLNESRQAELKRLEKLEEKKKVDRTIYKHGEGRKLASSITTTLGQDSGTRGLSEEAKAKLERERRARAAEARMKKLQGK
uniref:ARAD1C24728p n=1 Tax=Blastobotrys adeninivorans TaxID=409370 RepID=A0A060T7U2_BLAAD